MRFRSTNRTPSYMSRPFQMRMVMMIVSLGIVILAIKVTSRASFWATMFPEDSAEVHTENTGSTGNGPESQPGLTGIPQVQMDEVLIARADDEQESSSSEAETATEETPVVESSLPILPDRPQVSGLEIDPVRFEPIEDYSVGVRPQESDSYFYTLYHAGQVPLETLVEAGEEDVARSAIRSRPGYYRGKVITIEGELRRLERIKAKQNAYGLEEFYSAWVITPTSDNVPYHVIAMFKDENLPVEELIEDSVPVRVSGYFFKIESYATGDLKPQMTQLLVARRITAAPARPTPISLSEGSNPGKWLFVIFSVVFVIAIWSAYRSTVGARRMRAHRKEVLESDGDLSELQGQASIDPGDALRKMAEEE